VSRAASGDMRMPSAEEFRIALNAVFAERTKSGASSVVVVSGDLHRAVGGYPAERGAHSMPNCCSVMRQAVRARDQVISSPPSGAGATLTIRYLLPR